MNTQKSRAGRVVALLGVLVVAMLVGGLWWWKSRPAQANTVELSMDGGKKLVINSNPTAADEDKIKAMWQQSMAEKMREYAALTPEAKKKYLDEQIDAMQEAKKHMVIEGPATQPSDAGPADGKTKVEVTGTPENRKVTVRVNAKAGDKQMMEDVSPEIRAMIAQYKADMKARLAERGLPDTGGMVIIRKETNHMTTK